MDIGLSFNERFEWALERNFIFFEGALDMALLCNVMEEKICKRVSDKSVGDTGPSFIILDIIRYLQILLTYYSPKFKVSVQKRIYPPCQCIWTAFIL